MGTCLRNKYIKCNKNISSYDNLDDWWHKSSSSELTVLSSVLATLILLCSLVNDQDNKPKIANMIFFLIRYWLKKPQCREGSQFHSLDCGMKVFELGRKVMWLNLTIIMVRTLGKLEAGFEEVRDPEYLAKREGFCLRLHGFPSSFHGTRLALQNHRFVWVIIIYLSVPQFLFLQNGSNSGNYLMRLLWTLNKTKCMEYRVLCISYLPVNIRFSCCKWIPLCLSGCRILVRKGIFQIFKISLSVSTDEEAEEWFA